MHTATSRRPYVCVQCLIVFATSLILTNVACRTDPAKRSSELVQSAEKYVAVGDYSKAIIEYKNAIKIEPRSAELQYKLGQAYLGNGQLQEAFFSYYKASELNPDYLPARLILGKFYLAGNRFEDATKAAQAILAKDPENIDGQILLADAYAGKNISEGIKLLDEVLQRHPDSVAAYLHLGGLYTKLGNPEAALQRFQKAVAVDPKSVDARETLARYYVTQNQFDKAEAEYRATVAAQPGSVDANLALASFYFRQQRFSEAEPVYRELVKLQKNSPQSRFTLANFYLKTGHADQARKLDEEIARDAPDFLPARLQVAEMALSQQRYDEADRVVGSVLKDRPKEPQALILQAKISLARQNPQKAVQDLENAQRLEPNVPALHYWKGVAYRLQGNLDLAQQSFEMALSLDEHYLDAQIALARLALDRGKSDAALRYAQQVLKEDPQQAVAHYLAGSAYANLKDLPRAEAELQTYIQSEPKSADGLTRLGDVRLMQHRYDEAEKEFEKALAIDSKQMKALTGLVNLYGSRGQKDKAIARIRQQIALGETAALYNLLGTTYSDMGELGPAEQSLKRALELDPHSSNTHTLLGSLYLREKANDKAVAELQEAVRIDPQNVGDWILLGALHQSGSQFELAKKDYETALAIDPNAAVAASSLAWLYCEHGGDLDKALELARRAKQALPNVTGVSVTLARIYYKRQLFDSAIPLLEEAVRRRPKDGQIRFQLAASLVGAGKKAEARRELDVALKLDASIQKDADYERVLGQL